MEAEITRVFAQGSFLNAVKLSYQERVRKIARKALDQIQLKKLEANPPTLSKSTQN